jgi:hypothetical protein
MDTRWIKVATVAAMFLVVLIIAFPLPALADGGPIVNADLWQYLSEGHQVAIITLQSETTAKIDLFISILDATTESHEVVFFVPVGMQTNDFSVYEKSLSAFTSQRTSYLDTRLRQAADNKRRALQTLFGGALLSNGALLTPLWAPFLLTGCSMAEQKAELTLTTQSSQISIFGINEDTDIDDLIETVGLPGSVYDTLSGLRGQQIAVVRLKTQPRNEEGGGNVGLHGESIEPGLHLSWQTSLVDINSRSTYTYPLGTGGSWARPIDLTRVYVVAPWGLDFDVSYPALGTKESGYDYTTGARILENLDTPAYAIDEARGKFGRIWRATYTLSNATEDITIATKKLSAFSRFTARAQDSARTSSLVFALVVGLAVWITIWTLLMPRFVGTADATRIRWYHSLAYPVVNVISLIFSVVAFVFLYFAGIRIPILVVLFVIPSAAILGSFMLFHGQLLRINKGKALRAFIFTSLVSSAAYLALAMIFAKIISVV